MRKIILCLIIAIAMFQFPLIQAQSPSITQKYTRNTCSDSTRADYQKSVDYFTAIIKTDSNDLNAYNKLGMSYYKLLDFDRAIVVFNQLIALDSCYNYALYNRAICKFFQKDKQGACIDIKAALQCTYQDTSNLSTYHEKFCNE